jgi:uncharacterized protein (TIGR02246 family)
MTKQSKDIAAIKKLAKDWSSVWNSGDVKALLSLFTKAPVLMPQGLPPVIGKRAIGSLYKPLFVGYTIKGKGTVVEIEVSGDLGYFRSSYTLTAAPKTGGEQIKSKGKSMFIVKRQSDGSWKISRLIDNSDIEQ